jgi:hypothetical protein
MNRGEVAPKPGGHCVSLAYGGLFPDPPRPERQTKDEADEFISFPQQPCGALRSKLASYCMNDGSHSANCGQIISSINVITYTGKNHMTPLNTLARGISPLIPDTT